MDLFFSRHFLRQFSWTNFHEFVNYFSSLFYIENSRNYLAGCVEASQSTNPDWLQLLCLQACQLCRKIRLSGLESRFPPTSPLDLYISSTLNHIALELSQFFIRFSSQEEISRIMADLALRSLFIHACSAAMDAASASLSLSGFTDFPLAHSH